MLSISRAIAHNGPAAPPIAITGACVKVTITPASHARRRSKRPPKPAITSDSGYQSHQ